MDGWTRVRVKERGSLGIITVQLSPVQGILIRGYMTTCLHIENGLVSVNLPIGATRYRDLMYPV